ncbi:MULTISPECIES: sulfite exporter TauE/SafE family protein [unclassified Meiothermus]|uniref:sulfite exporter TauE/SafE family protein n=1 Tax=unclassified Meiothermus TaxID=370471 RepID=UPI000D7C3D40|nr:MULTISPECIES: sulfite exporter TauE/SafE family protein [unclassified Meiothermus]PZA06771.1 sulfite exporter TauE/SafE family protein [Meiothermus sp. Pnk-1]RYM36675.1 sulfite exporter TauE/SafE family protein [Meiothermus sp. PNK-Is4]
MLLAWVGALLIGLVLGMLGSGGSILTVPILVYLVGEPEKLAVAESLAIVGTIALVGSLPYALRALVDWKSGVVFGIPGTIGTYAGAWLSQFVSGGVQLGLFAVVMLLAAFIMARPKGLRAPRTSGVIWKTGLGGGGVGTVVGLVGVGGGFLIVPALVLLGGLPMHLAVGTSLLVIALNSAVGFYKYLHLLPALGLTVHWDLVFLFSVLGIAGSFLGGRIGVRLPQEALRRGFAGFLVWMGLYIFWQSLSRLLTGSG